MGLKQDLFVVAQSFSVLNPYNIFNPDPNVISLDENVPTEVLSIDVCVKKLNKTKVSLDSMVQIAILDIIGDEDSISFAVSYDLLRNGIPITFINDLMDIATPGDGNIFRYTNFPNFPVIDNDPIFGMNNYALVCTRFQGPTFVFAGSRSLKATVITL
ncbi:hypothetical protein [Chengkuizengella axinellae]|uniref:DUF4183 domain-containing protein n=1 Tax=Chengkuizengella axinellae TaxID=3064388 RepID=A0ABT9ITI7_9BACL|nr:hypothetical protein [Chengkuizengella sp. 2205SS18-9]MDP5272665.1 hypothetical protein [Chengkuizengella sp. 2205SS18-9]